VEILHLIRERRLAEAYVTKLAIKMPTVDQKATYLSGGNQQRVVIAKCDDIAASKMTPDQLAEAQRMALEWKPVTSR